jgi:putative Mn2+ efflux pump MntP
VYLGKAIGNKLADKAEFIGGLVLVAIGVKILLEGLL